MSTTTSTRQDPLFLPALLLLAKEIADDAAGVTPTPFSEWLDRLEDRYLPYPPQPRLVGTHDRATEICNSLIERLPPLPWLPWPFHEYLLDKAGELSERAREFERQDLIEGGDDA